MLFFSSCLFKLPAPEYPVCSNWSAQTHLSQHPDNNKAAVVNQLLCAKLAVGTYYAIMWHGDVVWCHKVTELKAGLLTTRFRNSAFCGREELLLVQTFVNCKDLLRAQEPIKHWRKGDKQKIVKGLHWIFLKCSRNRSVLYKLLTVL